MRAGRPSFLVGWPTHLPPTNGAAAEGAAAGAPAVAAEKLRCVRASCATRGWEREVSDGGSGPSSTGRLPSPASSRRPGCRRLPRHAEVYVPLLALFHHVHGHRHAQKVISGVTRSGREVRPSTRRPPACPTCGNRTGHSPVRRPKCGWHRRPVLAQASTSHTAWWRGASRASKEWLSEKGGAATEKGGGAGTLWAGAP